MSLVLDGVSTSISETSSISPSAWSMTPRSRNLLWQGLWWMRRGKAHLNGSSVAGRAVMLLRGHPRCGGSSEQSSFFQELSLKSKRMEAEGASLLLVVTPELDSLEGADGALRLTNPR